MSSPPKPKAPQTAPVIGLDSGYKMVGPVIMGLMIGYFIDQQFNTSPWFLLGLIFFGLVTGFWSVLKPLYLPKTPPEPDPDMASKPDP